jgi:hypothetical protein
MISTAVRNVEAQRRPHRTFKALTHSRTLLTNTGDVEDSLPHHPAARPIAMCRVGIVVVDKRGEAATTVTDPPNVVAAAILLRVYHHLLHAAPAVPRLPAARGRDPSLQPLVAAAIRLQRAAQDPRLGVAARRTELGLHVSDVVADTQAGPGLLHALATDRRAGITLDLSPPKKSRAHQHPGHFLPPPHIVEDATLSPSHHQSHAHGLVHGLFPQELRAVGRRGGVPLLLTRFRLIQELIFKTSASARVVPALPDLGVDQSSEEYRLRLLLTGHSLDENGKLIRVRFVVGFPPILMFIASSMVTASSGSKYSNRIDISRQDSCVRPRIYKVVKLHGYTDRTRLRSSDQYVSTPASERAVLTFWVGYGWSGPNRRALTFKFKFSFNCNGALAWLQSSRGWHNPLCTIDLPDPFPELRSFAIVACLWLKASGSIVLGMGDRYNQLSTIFISLSSCFAVQQNRTCPAIHAYPCHRIFWLCCF